MLSRRSAKYKQTVAGPPGEITFLGTDTVVIDNSTPGDHTEQVTVPAGTTFAAVGFVMFTNQLDVGVNSASLDGQPMTLIQRGPWAQFVYITDSYYVSGFSSGVVNLSWNQDNLERSMAVILAFYSGVNNSDPIRDNGIDSGTSSSGTLVVDLLLSQPNDYLCGYGTSIVTSPANMDQNGQNERVRDLVLENAINASYADKLQGTPEGDDIVVTQSYGALNAFTLKPA